MPSREFTRDGEPHAEAYPPSPVRVRAGTARALLDEERAEK